MLWEFLQVLYMEVQLLRDQAIYTDLVGSSIEVRDGSVVAIVSTFFRDEAENNVSYMYPPYAV